MKKRLTLVITAFVLVSVMAFSAVGVVLFLNHRQPVQAGDSELPAGYCRVEFNTCGGSKISSERVRRGQAVAEPTKIPTIQGGTFLGWYADADYTQKYDFTQPVNRNITLYAKWDITLYTVTFDTCGGNEVASQKIVQGGYLDDVTPVWDGYEFLGWFLDDTYLTKFDFDNTKITMDITLYAKWSIGFKLGDDGTYQVQRYTGTAESITIPTSYRGVPVTKVAGGAFMNCTNLTSVVLEEGIKEIGNLAFMNCVNLTAVTLPSTLTSIGVYAFGGCENLQSISIPDGVTIGEFAFLNCPAHA